MGFRKEVVGVIEMEVSVSYIHIYFLLKVPQISLEINLDYTFLLQYYAVEMSNAY